MAAELRGGNSNITLLVESNSGRCVLRRPPTNSISPLAARGVRREYDVLSALDGALAAPRALAFCTDPSIIGAPFAIFSWLPGVAITTELPVAYATSADAVARIGQELVDGLASVHRVDPGIVDLPRSSNPQPFLSRQIERWVKIRQADRVRDLPLVETVAAELSRRQPRHCATALLHGDFHLDNTLFHVDRPTLAGIIDWELAAVGDPMADLGLLLAFWGPRQVEPAGFDFVQAVSRDAGPDRESLADGWAAASGLDVIDLPYYCAFALWRLAATVEGAYVLHRRGRVDSDYARNLAHEVPRLFEEAAAILGLSTRSA